MRHIPLLTLTSVAVGAIAGNTFVGHDGAPAGAGDDAFGIADYDAASGDAFAATVIGTQRVVAGGAFNKGDSLQVGAGSKAIVLAAGTKVAKAMEDSAGDGSMVTVLLTP